MPADITVSIRGINEFVKKHEPMQRADILEAPVTRGVERVKSFMAKYPRQRNADSTYRRTGTLGRRWTTRVRKTPRGVTGRVGNNTTYGPPVQSERFQAEIHKDWWQTDRDAIRTLRRPIVRDFEQTIQRAIR